MSEQRISEGKPSGGVCNPDDGDARLLADLAHEAERYLDRPYGAGRPWGFASAIDRAKDWLDANTGTATTAERIKDDMGGEQL